LSLRHTAQIRGWCLKDRAITIVKTRFYSLRGKLGGRGRSKKSCGLAVIAALAFACTLFSMHLYAGELTIALGEPFPDLIFQELLSDEDYGKLDLPVGGEVRISSIPGDFLIIEFFNKSCVPCQTQVREMEEYYEELLESAEGGRIKVLAVGVGNKAKYLPRFIKKRGMSYAVAADPDFEQWRRLGDPGRTPFIVFLRRENHGWTLNNYTVGIQTKDELALHGTMLLKGIKDGGPLLGVDSARRHMQMPLKDAEVEALATRMIISVVGGEVPVEKVSEKDEGLFFRGWDKKHQRWVYAHAASRAPVCEVCHAVHFIYCFDDAGRILSFSPIYVTKYGNQVWDEKDAAFISGRLDGRFLRELEFDPNVDAVSKATMSSALIFDEIRRTLPALKKLNSIK